MLAQQSGSKRRRRGGRRLWPLLAVVVLASACSAAGAQEETTETTTTTTVALPQLSILPRSEHCITIERPGWTQYRYHDTPTTESRHYVYFARLRTTTCYDSAGDSTSLDIVITSEGQSTNCHGFDYMDDYQTQFSDHEAVKKELRRQGFDSACAISERNSRHYMVLCNDDYPICQQYHQTRHGLIPHRKDEHTPN